MSISAWNISLKKDKKNCLAHNTYILRYLLRNSMNSDKNKTYPLKFSGWTLFLVYPKKNGQNCAVLEQKFEKKCNFNAMYLFLSYVKIYSFLFF